jgi:hypothetical protein
MNNRLLFFFSYSFFTSIGIIIACIQLTYLICCGCSKPKGRLRMLSYTSDLLWAIVKEVPQIIIIFQINLCRDGSFQISSLFKAIFSIVVTIWKLYNLYTFLRDDVRSEDTLECCREKHLYWCFPTILIPIWLVNLALSIMIAVLFFLRHHGEGYIKIPGSIHRLYVHDKYLYTKYIVRSGIYLSWPDNNYENSYMKLAEIDYIMANKKATVHLLFNLPYVCFERSLSNRTSNQCFRFHPDKNSLSMVSINEFNHYRGNQKPQNATFTFHYRPQSNKYNLGQIRYNGHVTSGILYLNKLLYFRLHEGNAQDDDFLYQNQTNIYEFYRVNQQLIPVVEAWKHGLAKCRPCLLGPRLSTN